jgi:antitoxin MazE
LERSTVKTALRKIGNSAGILIPKPFLAELGLQAGDPVDIRVRKGRIAIEPIKRKGRRARAEASDRIAADGAEDSVPAPPEKRAEEPT